MNRTALHRAASNLTVRALEEDRDHFIIRGVATHPAPDRVDDIVEPLGCTFQNPVVLLWQHAHDKPLGTVQFDKPTKDGVRFTARLPKLIDPGVLKDRIDEAVQAVKAGIIKAVSIGFRALKGVPLATGGTRWTKCEIIELSLVSVPAQPLAVIDEVRSTKQRIRRGSDRVVKLTDVELRGAGRGRLNSQIERETLELVRTLPMDAVLSCVLPTAKGAVLKAIIARSGREAGRTDRVVRL